MRNLDCPYCGNKLDPDKLVKTIETEETKYLIHENTSVFCPSCNNKVYIDYTTIFKNKENN